MIQPWPHQAEAIEKVHDARKRGLKKAAIQMPTGCGKSLVQALLTREAVDCGENVSYVVPFDHLVDNALDTLHLLFKPDEIGIVKAEKNQLGRPVTICSVQTIINDARLQQVAGTFDRVFADEMHLIVADRFAEATQALPREGGELIGFSASIKRMDGKSLADVFGELIYHRPLWEMIRDGWLCNLVGIQLNAEINLEAAERGRDFDDEVLESLFNTTRQQELIFQGWQEYAGDRVTMAFTPSVRVAHEYAAYWNAKGVPSVAVDGSMPDAECDKRVAQFRDGHVQALFNCLDTDTEILTPGGWKRRKQLRVGELMGAFNTEDSSIKWVPIEAIVERELAEGEKMYHYKSRCLDMCMTGGHDLVMRKSKSFGKPRIEFGGWEKGRVDSTLSMYSFDIPIAGYQNATGVPLTEPELKFLGWFLSDGTITKDKKIINISQAQHNTHLVADLEKCLQDCNFKYSKYVGKRKTNFNETSPLCRYTLCRGARINQHTKSTGLRGWDAIAQFVDKDLSPALNEITKEQLCVLLYALHLGDGAKTAHNVSPSTRGYCISSGNKTFVDRLQSLCVRRGIKCNYSTHYTPQGSAYYLLLVHINKTSAGISNTVPKRPHFEEVSYSEKTVWCVSNKLGTIIMRRNGKVAITGNCNKLVVGFDHKPISAILMMRPTRSQTLYQQIIGRSSRICRDDYYAACTKPIKDRVKPNKTDSLILDVVGATDLGLEQFPGLFDLPSPEVILKRQRAGEAIEARELIVHHQPLYDAKAIVATRVDLVGESHFTWVKTAFGWAIHLDRTLVSVVKSGRRDFTVEALLSTEDGQERVEIQGDPVALDWAMVLAEDWVQRQVDEKPELTRLIQRNAQWRDDRVTERQFAVLKRQYRKMFKPFATYQEYLESGQVLSKGEASEMIGARFAEKDRRKAQHETS